MDRGVWWAIMLGVTESDTTEQLNNSFVREVRLAYILLDIGSILDF